MPITPQTKSDAFLWFAAISAPLWLPLLVFFLFITYLNNLSNEETLKTIAAIESEHVQRQNQIRIRYQGALEALHLDQDLQLSALVSAYTASPDIAHRIQLANYVADKKLAATNLEAFWTATDNYANQSFDGERRFALKTKPQFKK